MFDRILLRMRNLVRAARYVATAHAIEEMEADGLGIFDVEHCVLTGRIVERQRDRQARGTKYVIAGWALNGERIHVIAKIGPTDKLVIITVFVA